MKWATTFEMKRAHQCTENGGMSQKAVHQEQGTGKTPRIEIRYHKPDLLWKMVRDRLIHVVLIQTLRDKQNKHLARIVL